MCCISWFGLWMVCSVSLVTEFSGWWQMCYGILSFKLKYATCTILQVLQAPNLNRIIQHTKKFQKAEREESPTTKDQGAHIYITMSYTLEETCGAFPMCEIKICKTHKTACLLQIPFKLCYLNYDKLLVMSSKILERSGKYGEWVMYALCTFSQFESKVST